MSVADRWWNEFLAWLEDLEERLRVRVQQLGGAKSSRFTVGLGGPASGELSVYVGYVSELLKRLGCQVLTDDFRSGPVWFGHQCSTADLVIILAMSPGSSAEAVELSNSETHKRNLLVYIPEEYRDGYVYRILESKNQLNSSNTFSLNELKNSSNSDLAVGLLKQVTNRFLTKENVEMRKRKDAELAQPADTPPQIGIITALPLELFAVECILQDPYPHSVPSSRGRNHHYIRGTIPSRDQSHHQIAACVVGKGNNAASAGTAKFLEQFPSVKHVLMVGIAGGVPNPRKAESHVRLGDVVVSDEYGVFQYDFGKQTDQGMEHLPPARPPGPELLETTRLLHADFERGEPSYWLHIDNACSSTKTKRPRKDTLQDSPWSKSPIAHPLDPKRVAGRPRLFQGKIGSANVVLKTASVRNKLRDLGVLAVEMEGSGVAEAAYQASAESIVIRGICDYTNSMKNKAWQKYAALAAAAYARSLIEFLPLMRNT
ncbi:MAG: hypothetical protein HYV07_07800 [Deltaproteobacteria bacterium]|nr:hypothetical protein [Deltaproteobacteria bacterium]